MGNCCCFAGISGAAQRKKFPYRQGVTFDDASGVFARNNVEVLASGFKWTEGPTWLREQGALLFSDTIDARIYKWHESSGAKVIFEDSGGFDGSNVANFDHIFEPGSNGMALRGQDLYVCQHPMHRVVKVSLQQLQLHEGKRFCECNFEVLADSWAGGRLNSPNDVIAAPNGDVLFTDPIYGFLQRERPEKGSSYLNAETAPGPDQPYLDERCTKEGTHFKGVYRVRDGVQSLLTSAMERPNGLALSPDGKVLWVANSEQGAPAWWAFEMSDKLPLKCLYQLNQSVLGVSFPGPGLSDGFKVDPLGRLWTSTPGGMAVIDPHEKRVVAKVNFGTNISNIEFGDGGDVFVTGMGYLWRLHRKI